MKIITSILLFHSLSLASSAIRLTQIHDQEHDPEMLQRKLDVIDSIPDYGSPLSNMYSGFLSANSPDTSTEDNNSLHYWLVESESQPEKDPLVLWLQGGPGASAMMGFFTEFGPLVFNNKEGVMRNPYTWSKKANYLFIEAPSGVGFSYCESKNGNKGKDKVCTNTDSTTTAANLAALHSFLKRFPEFKGREFFITGESYAGVYVPLTSKAVVDDVTLDLKLTGVMVGNPCTDDATQNRFLGWNLNYAHINGIISDSMYNTLIDKCGVNEWDPMGLSKSHNDECTALYRQYEIAISDNILNLGSIPGSGYLPNYNVWGAKNQVFWDQAARWLNKPEVQKTIHVDHLNFTWGLFASRLNYIKEYSSCWDMAGTPKFKTSMIEIYQYLVPKIRNIVVYNGDSDPSVQMRGTQNAVKAVGKREVQDHGWRPWFYKTVATPIGTLIEKSPYWGLDLSSVENGVQLAGYVVDYEDGLSFVTIHDSGHMVPQYKTVLSEHLFNFVLQNRRLSPPLPTQATMSQASDSAFYKGENSIFTQWVKTAQSPKFTGETD